MVHYFLNIYAAHSDCGTMASNVTLSVIHGTERQMKKMALF